MAKRQPATRIFLARQAARRYRALFPELVRIAHAPLPDPAAGDSPPEEREERARLRAQARADLARDGYLTAAELDALPLAEATELALGRLRERLPIVAQVEREERGGRR